MICAGVAAASSMSALLTTMMSASSVTPFLRVWRSRAGLHLPDVIEHVFRAHRNGGARAVDALDARQGHLYTPFGK